MRKLNIEKVDIFWHANVESLKRKIRILNLPQVPSEKCWDETVEKCEQVPTQECWDEEKKACSKVPRRECAQVPRENCTQIPHQTCAKVATSHRGNIGG